MREKISGSYMMACGGEVIPLQQRIETVDDADLEKVYNTERHLLYVYAAARSFVDYWGPARIGIPG